VDRGEGYNLFLPPKARKPKTASKSCHGDPSIRHSQAIAQSAGEIQGPLHGEPRRFAVFGHPRSSARALSSPPNRAVHAEQPS
jgi:hypothetical protein